MTNQPIFSRAPCSLSMCSSNLCIVKDRVQESLYGNPPTLLRALVFLVSLNGCLIHCTLQVRFSEFVRAHLDTWPGPIVEEETNEIVGYHEGFWFYTLGQRKGIFLSGGPWCATHLHTLAGFMMT